MITNNGEQFVQSPPLHHMTLVSVLLPSRCSLQQTDRKQCATHLKACLAFSCPQSLCWSSSSAYCPRIDTGHIAIIFLLTVLQNDSPLPIHSLSIFVGAMIKSCTESLKCTRWTGMKTAQFPYGTSSKQTQHCPVSHSVACLSVKHETADIFFKVQLWMGKCWFQPPPISKLNQLVFLGNSHQTNISWKIK